MPVFIHGFDCDQLADSRRHGVMQIGLTEATVPQVEVGHFDALAPHGRTPEGHQGLLGGEAADIVHIERATLRDERRHLLGRGEGQIAR